MVLTPFLPFQRYKCLLIPEVFPPAFFTDEKPGFGLLSSGFDLLQCLFGREWQVHVAITIFAAAGLQRS
jgi:hypothetical protein